MSLMDVVEVLQRMGEEIRANTADAEAATKAVREYNAAEQRRTASSMPSAGGSVAGTMGSSSGNDGGGNAVTAAKLTSALQSLKGRTQ